MVEISLEGKSKKADIAEVISQHLEKATKKVKHE
jgi:hypothetical protein